MKIKIINSFKEYNQIIPIKTITDVPGKEFYFSNINEIVIVKKQKNTIIIITNSNNKNIKEIINDVQIKNEINLIDLNTKKEVTKGDFYSYFPKNNMYFTNEEGKIYMASQRTRYLLFLINELNRITRETNKLNISYYSLKTMAKVIFNIYRYDTDDLSSSEILAIMNKIKGKNHIIPKYINKLMEVKNDIN